ncbi:MAG: diaminopimelate decarboxylase [Bacteroidales bacterium]|nr:diaminopimelate decarboxylase [Bacteroidales bacterium]
MLGKQLPFNKAQIEGIINQFPTPFHIYDEKAMVENAKKLVQAFAWNEGFKEFFAVKATPNPFIIKLLKQVGFGADCSSLPEIELSEKAGITGSDIMFTSNNTPVYEYKKALEIGANINLDDISHIDYLEQNVGLPNIIACRYNPGSLKAGNTIIGEPEDAKYGFTKEQMFEGYRILKDKGIKRFGIHTMVASNELNPDYFIETAELMFNLVVELHKKLDIRFEFINLGGGIGIPYRPEQKPVDLQYVSNGIRKKFDEIIVANGLAPIKLFWEAGRVITGPYGYLVTKVQHIKKTYKKFVGLDASMSNLMRPALYGAYHHITVLGKENAPLLEKYDVTGSLCENNDKFAIARQLPIIEPNDILVIHDSGAHGHAMGFNYNAKLRSSELLLRTDESVLEIRRAETIEDYFATLNFDNLKHFN